MDKIFEDLKALSDEYAVIAKDEPMNKHCTFKVGGPADYFVTVGDVESFGAMVNYAKTNKIPYIILGNGSNVIVKDKGIRGIVFSMLNSEILSSRLLFDGLACAGAGAKMSTLALECANAGYSGLEFSGGIPGSVGGGVYMNAGAYGGALGDLLYSVQILGEDGFMKEIPASECPMAYRDTRFMKTGKIIIGAKFKLKEDDPEAILARMKDLNEQRRAKQPLEYPSAGSTFKRPEGYFAGKLIQDAGLKGFTVGGAEVSEKHAGFVINKGGATAADILDLIEEVQEKVYAEFGVRLEREVRVLGE
ncbi:MAG: UDP-N-acetylmuramate dehydrogenase [Lachnospiraceae bacterium]|nr:UDP-N-acetylmuramate dehydrogenase [Lachnospiraceae bacterium]